MVEIYVLARRPLVEGVKRLELSKRDFIFYKDLGENGTSVGRFEVAKDVTYKGTHFILADNSLYMPPAPLFFEHFIRVRNAARGEGKLFNAAGDELTSEEVQALDTKLTRDSWSWLDGHLIPSKDKEGFRKLDLVTNTKVVVEGNERILQGERTPLERCVDSDCFVDLDGLNEQGFPKERAKTQEYRKGENMYFSVPRMDSVLGSSLIPPGSGLTAGIRRARTLGSGYFRVPKTYRIFEVLSRILS